MAKFKVWLFFLGLALLVFFPAFSYGFSQDDFFHLSIAHADSLGEFLAFFNPASHDWIFFRPLSTQLWYFVFLKLFGYSRAALPMHLAALLLHSLNAYLVYLLSRRFLAPRLAVISGVLYLVAGVHFLSLFYLGATQQLLATLFLLLATRASLARRQLPQIGFFLLALLAKELSLRFVPLIIFLHYLQTKSLKSALKRSGGILVMGVLYLAMRSLVGVELAPEYALSFSPFTALATLMWYLLMSFGFPEYLLNFGLSAGRIDFASYFTAWPPFTSLNLVASFGSLGLFLLALKKSHWPHLVIWLLGLSPVILLPTHRYAHYLDLSLIPLLLIILSFKKRALSLIAVTLLLLANLTSLTIDEHTHWTTQRAKLAQHYLAKLAAEGACAAPEIVFTGDEIILRDLSYALMNAHGPQLFCANPHLRVYYRSELTNQESSSAIRIPVDHSSL